MKKRNLNDLLKTTLITGTLAVTPLLLPKDITPTSWQLQAGSGKSTEKSCGAGKCGAGSCGSKKASKEDPKKNQDKKNKKTAKSIAAPKASKGASSSCGAGSCG